MLVNISMRVANVIEEVLSNQYDELTGMAHRHDAYGDGPLDPDTAGRIKDLESWFRSHGLAINANNERTIDPESDATFVSSYLVSRVSGGSEEGGWWYDCYTFNGVLDIQDTKEEAVAQAARLTEEAKIEKKERGERDRFSVIGTDDEVIVAERFPRQRHTLHRPIYC